jgi:hypothetical protein
MSEPTPTPKTSQWVTGLVTGAIGLIGVALGGFLQYYTGGSLETEKQRMQIQISAYADFAKGQAAWQRARAEADESKKEEAFRDASLKIRDAAFRIVIFSPAELVRALAAFVEENHKEECETTEADLTLYRSIRRHVSSSDHVSNQDIAMALFGCKLK